MEGTGMPDQELSPERTARREEIRKLTRRGAELYEALQTNATARNELILKEMTADPPAVAREISEITGLTVARIYKLRDNAKKEQ
jgi:DNA-binding MarR family transcriptional regulator